MVSQGIPDLSRKRTIWHGRWECSRCVETDISAEETDRAETTEKGSFPSSVIRPAENLEEGNESQLTENFPVGYNCSVDKTCNGELVNNSTNENNGTDRQWDGSDNGLRDNTSAEDSKSLNTDSGDADYEEEKGNDKEKETELKSSEKDSNFKTEDECTRGESEDYDTCDKDPPGDPQSFDVNSGDFHRAVSSQHHKKQVEENISLLKEETVTEDSGCDSSRKNINEPWIVQDYRSDSNDLEVCESEFVTEVEKSNSCVEKFDLSESVSENSGGSHSFVALSLEDHLSEGQSNLETNLDSSDRTPSEGCRFDVDGDSKTSLECVLEEVVPENIEPLAEGEARKTDISEASCVTHSEQIATEGDMGRKSGSFSKKNGGMYVYSKDEFRESYQSAAKPKTASRSQRSQPPANKSNKGIPPRQKSSRLNPTPMSAGSSSTADETPGAGSVDSSHQSGPTVAAAASMSTHSHVTVELLSSDRSSPLHSPPADIDHSFVVSDQGDGLPEVTAQREAKGSIPNGNGKKKPVPVPRSSISSHSSLNQEERHTESPETGVPSSPSSLPLSPTAKSPTLTGNSPDLSEIMCITRTVDGEEELILGAGPMFANQKKLTMESAAILQSVNKSLMERDTATGAADSWAAPKGLKNYACIEPVGQPVDRPETANRMEDTFQQNHGTVEEPAPPVVTDLPEQNVDKKDEDKTKLKRVIENGSLLNNHGEGIEKVEKTDERIDKVIDESREDEDDDDGDDEDDDDEGVYDEAFHVNDWVYLGTKDEIGLVNGNEEGDNSLDPADIEDPKSSSTLSSASSMDSLETTSSEKDFKDQYSSLSLRKIKREGSVLGYRKLTDITKERELVINFDEGAKSYGFRIQYSKPAIVTEVDSGGAAEKQGLLVGDVVLGVNGTDVKKAPHATVVNLVQSGPSELHLLVGTNMCNSPNQDLFKPIKTGYMHKLGGQGMLKNWKKRWFVLKHDGCLYYYKTKEDVDPLGAVVLTNYTLMRARDVGKTHCFKISKYKARTYYFYTETEVDMSSWAKCITEAAQKKTNADVWLDISTHNVGLPALSIKNPDCRGFLTKQGNAHKSWKRRYCVLKDACMYYYTDIKQPQALGIVHFHGYKIQETELAGKKHGFMLQPPLQELRTYYFIADNETDRKRWVAALASSIGRWIQTNEEDQFSQTENDKDHEMLI